MSVARQRSLCRIATVCGDIYRRHGDLHDKFGELCLSPLGAQSGRSGLARPAMNRMSDSRASRPESRPTENHPERSLDKASGISPLAALEHRIPRAREARSSCRPRAAFVQDRVGSRSRHARVRHSVDAKAAAGDQIIHLAIEMTAAREARPQWSGAPGCASRTAIGSTTPSS